MIVIDNDRFKRKSQQIDDEIHFFQNDLKQHIIIELLREAKQYDHNEKRFELFDYIADLASWMDESEIYSLISRCIKESNSINRCKDKE